MLFFLKLFLGLGCSFPDNSGTVKKVFSNFSVYELLFVTIVEVSLGLMRSV